MLVKGLIIAAVMAVPVSATASSLGIDISRHATAEGCASNCAVIIKHRGRFMSVAKDATGDIFRAQILDIPVSAKMVNRSSQDATVMGAQSGDDGWTETETQTYEGRDGYWVVTTIIQYDGGGNIVDVYSQSTYFPKHQRK